jgi:hypothetical protein
LQSTDEERNADIDNDAELMHAQIEHVRSVAENLPNEIDGVGRLLSLPAKAVNSVRAAMILRVNEEVEDGERKKTMNKAKIEEKEETKKKRKVKKRRKNNKKHMYEVFFRINVSFCSLSFFFLFLLF